MESFVKRSYLYDFYGPLLTDKQRRIYEEVVLNDYSLSEVAEDEGISRQSVYDMIKRCDRIFQNYEDKLGMVEKYKKMEKLVKTLDDKKLSKKILDIF